MGSTNCQRLFFPPNAMWYLLDYKSCACKSLLCRLSLSLTTPPLIRLQRINNLWLFHAIILPVLDVYGFTIHFYIIFGTNLLTGGPARIAVFLPISVFGRKGISNGVQTEWNLRERSFWNKRNSGDLEWMSRSSRGGHEGARRALGGWARPRGVGAPPTLVGPSWLPWLTSFAYIYFHTLKTSRSATNPIFTSATFCTREISSWGIFRCSAEGGINHGGLLHQHHSLFDKLWVVYHRPSGS